MPTPTPALRDVFDPSSVAILPFMGDRWTLWLLAALDEREPRRFSELSGAQGLSKRVLSERLKELQHQRQQTQRQHV